MPGIEETMPIIPVGEHKYNWIKKAAQHTKQHNSLHETSVLKCPAIFQFKNKGFILRAPYDILLTIESDLKYRWNTSYDTTIHLQGTQPEVHQIAQKQAVTHHDTNGLYDFMSSWPKDTMKIILKLNLPWTLRIPKGYDVLMTDPFYKDDDRFTVCTGMFESTMGIGLLTVPVKWHSTQGEYLIKAGTAIAQLIPIKKEKISHQNLNLDTDKNFRRDSNITFLKKNENFHRNFGKFKEWIKDKI
tara:strand:- start:96 stop:827 length:732 start_codon:yes stop_codon:yes gene_type:complete